MENLLLKKCRKVRGFVLGAVILCVMLSAMPGYSQTSDVDGSSITYKNMDPAVKPGDNFYNYANGEWLRTTTLPPGLPYYGNLIELNLRVEQQLGKIIDSIVSHGPYSGTSPAGQIKAMYESYLNEDLRDSKGLEPLRKEINAIEKAKTHKDIAKLMGQPMMPTIFGGYVFLDSKNTQKYITYLEQGGLAMGSRDVYLEDTGPYPQQRKAYLDYIKIVLETAGVGNAEEKAKKILEFETAMAKVLWSKVQLRDKTKMYHKMTPAELKTYAPGFDWEIFWNEMGMAGMTELVVRTDDAVQKLAKLFKDTPVDVLKDYMLLRLIGSNGSYLTKALDEANFNFFDKVLTGTDVQRPIKIRAVNFANQFTADQLGVIYADIYFTDAKREKVTELVGYLKRAMRERMAANPWMDDETKAEALRKFDNIHWKIGRPERINDFSSMDFKSDDIIGNLRKLSIFGSKDAAAKIKEPKRDWEWLKPPQIVNAYYQAEMNDVVLPVGILQAPVFDPNSDAAENFGGVLAVVGHEVGHGFDDNGSQSDADGLLRNWWSSASRTEFERRANILVEQYNGYSPIEGVFLNGKLTLGENIGDLGGVWVAHHAYQEYVNEHQGGNAPVINGFTGEQRFFLAYGQLWSFMNTDDLARKWAVIDNHSPGRFRVNGVVRNVDAWYDAFNIKEGDSLYLPPEQRVVIW